MFGEINFIYVGMVCLGVLSSGGFGAFLCRGKYRVHHSERLDS